MPELPEVETTRRGLERHLVGRRIVRAVVRNARMRQPIPKKLPGLLAGATIRALTRRAKYLLIECTNATLGTLIVHLGMSGRLWLVDSDTPPAKHDHFDLVLDSGKTVRLRDPRRFGLVLWHEGDISDHPLFAKLGPEPLSDKFDGAALYAATRTRSSAIKLVIMDSHVVVGVGNIYASEALFRAGISPRVAARRLTRARCDALAGTIRETLAEAITAGGSSIRDYVGGDGMAGNFQSNFSVYDRAGEACKRCGAIIKRLQQGQRSTFYCTACQR